MKDFKRLKTIIIKNLLLVILIFVSLISCEEKKDTEKDVRKDQITEKRKLGGACDGLDELVQMIGDKDKNVNCMQKTRIDWDKHTKEENLEA